MRPLALALTALALACAAVPAHAVEYQFIDLGRMTASGLNASGQVVGTTLAADGPTQAFVTGAKGQGITYLGTLAGGSRSEGLGLNDAGQVVGSSYTADGRSAAFIYDPSQTGLRALGTLTGDTTSAASAINASGQVVGISANDAGTIRHVYITSANGGQMQEVAGTASLNAHLVSGVNDAGQVIGRYTKSVLQDSQGFVTGANGQALQMLAYVPLAINNSGHIAGYFSSTYGSSAALDGGTVSYSTSPVRSGSAGQYVSMLPSAATAINDKGLVGGFYLPGPYTPWPVLRLDGDGRAETFSISLPGADPKVPPQQYFNQIIDINSAGDLLLSTNYGRAYLAIAVPEPATVASMMLGLLAIGAVSRRKA